MELTLNPEELGRVRMTLATHDAGITVTIVAERADTLDLMRRHIDQLNREFQDLGFDNIAFSFAGGQRGDDPDTPERDGPRAEGDKDVPSQPAIAAHSLSLGPADGLDLRL
ncbi:flagellar hook-length control protein FliK [Sulfitobacter sabulilitoris]|uniref:flagellar hook-length control protein FliK n=1 Tax=Sulfitobacter sabulilitoris TaxID=2562655 RepID=UPI0014783C89|nr:flagellar hook-length control protein FliK [Sulfitobacter sabulilitoris]